MRITGILVVLLLVLYALPGCSTPERRDEGAQSMPVSAETATQFGGVTLPAGVHVLGAATDSGRDTRYQLAIRVNADQLAQLLAQFPQPPRASDIPTSMPVIAGPALSSATAPRYAQDRTSTAEYGTVTREIVVDERSPDEVYVHLAFYAT